MNIRSRIFILFVITLAGGVIGLVSWIQEEMRPRYMEAQEDPLVDTAHLVAALIQAHGLNTKNNTTQFDTRFLQQAFDQITGQTISVQIYALHKDKVDIRLYVTNQDGLVVYDSDHQRDLGKDYSEWRDVKLTLEGQYGARSTEGDPLYPANSTMYIAAPIYHNKKIVGVVSIGKPTRNVERFSAGAVNDLKYAALFVALIAIILAFFLYRWVSYPLQQLHDYAKEIQKDQRVTSPKFGNNEIGKVAKAMTDMRSALDGKAYITDYVATLTHELKSPTAAIRGASELLQEDMPLDMQQRFIRNIHNESCRLHDIIDRLMELASIESRSEIENPQRIQVNDLFNEVTESLHPLAQAKQIHVQILCQQPLQINGDHFLLRQALDNLLKNAIEFSPANSQITLQASIENQLIQIHIIDQGIGIPEYAEKKAFDRFFSLPRDNGQKGTGLGLSFVREIAALHGGQVSIKKCHPKGTQASFCLPR